MIPHVVFRGRLRVFSVHLASPRAAKAHYSLFVFPFFEARAKSFPLLLLLPRQRRGWMGAWRGRALHLPELLSFHP